MGLYEENTARANQPAGSATVTSVTLGAGVASQVLAADTTRRGAAIFNGTGQPVFLKLGAGATATSFTLQLVASAYYEVPSGYTGVITAFSTAASASPHLMATSLGA